MALDDDIINHFFRNSAVSAPTTHFLALFTVAPDKYGSGGTEVAGGSYARQAITLGAPVLGITSNTNALDYLVMPAADVVYGGIYTLVTGGVFLRGGYFSSTRSVTAGKTFTVPAGDFILRQT